LTANETLPSAVAPPESAESGPGTRALPEVGSAADKFANIAVTVVPFLLLGFAVTQAWGGALHWQDVLIFTVMFVPIGFGVTVGYHRLFTHRSFETSRPMRAIWAILGSAAVEGPVIEWVAYHRKHHAFSDEDGDPHSPHVGHGEGWRGAVRGLFHAHIGWVWFSDDLAEEERYARDLLKDPVVKAIDKTFLVWVLASLALPFGLGVALTGRVSGGLTAMLWGGAVRIFLTHQITFSINSLCHFFGRRSYETGDESRNLAWLSVFTFGESWHNNHHAFPTSARHGLDRWEIDFSGMLISAMERLGLAWNVVRISPERRASKALT
jgi:stearoyl-CoA desaturase (delta-9 desaturase)